MKKYCLIFSILFVLAGCSKSGFNRLKSIEKILDVNPVEAGIRLDSIEPSNLHGKGLAMYAMLRTQADYLTGKSFTSDSLARIATGYWNSRKKDYHAAMSWYSLGCVYSDMGKDPEAIYALLKAKELFPDTLSANYMGSLYMLGTHYNSRKLYDDAINSFSACKRAYERIGDSRNVSLSEYNIGISYFGKKEYTKAREIFEHLLTDSNLDADNRNSCYLYLAHVENGLLGKEGNLKELELVNLYLDGCTDEESRIPGYALKGIALYYSYQTDSAFEYLRIAHDGAQDMDTRILAVKGLEWVAIQMRNYQAAWNAEILNKQYQEELNKMSNLSEITQIQLQHNDEIQNQRFHSRVSKIILVSISLVILLIALAVIFNIQRDRKREAYYLKKYEDFVQKQMEDKATAKGNRLTEACEAFRGGIAFNLVGDVIMQHRSFRQEERDVVVHDINLYFASLIAALRDEAGRLGQQDINLIFCTLLGFDQEVIADIMCTSRSNLRSIKSRLKSKISPESFSLYFKE